MWIEIEVYNDKWCTFIYTLRHPGVRSCVAWCEFSRNQVWLSLQFPPHPPPLPTPGTASSSELRWVPRMTYNCVGATGASPFCGCQHSPPTYHLTLPQTPFPEAGSQKAWVTSCLVSWAIATLTLMSSAEYDFSV